MRRRIVNEVLLRGHVGTKLRTRPPGWTLPMRRCLPPLPMSSRSFTAAVVGRGKSGSSSSSNSSNSSSSSSRGRYEMRLSSSKSSNSRSSSRRYLSSGRGTRGGGFRQGDGDNSNPLNMGFDLFGDADADKAVITGYDPDGFWFGETLIKGSVLVFPTDKVLWAPTQLSEITIESLKLVELAEPKIELLIVGVGGRQKKRLPASFESHFLKQGIAIEQMDSPHALSTFNILNAEDRRVAVALLSIEPFDHSEAKLPEELEFDYNKKY